MNIPSFIVTLGPIVIFIGFIVLIVIQANESAKRGRKIDELQAAKKDSSIGPGS